MQYAIDTKTHNAQFAAWFHMDIRRALIEGVLPQPVDNAYDVLIVGVKLLVGFPQLDQLLKVADIAAAAGRLAGCALDRFGEVVKLDLETTDVIGTGNNAADFLVAQDRLEFRFPGALKRFRRRNHDFIRFHFYRQYAEARRIGDA